MTWSFYIVGDLSINVPNYKPKPMSETQDVKGVYTQLGIANILEIREH